MCYFIQAVRYAAKGKEMDKLGKESLLYDFYGELLTKRQQEIYENVRFGDLSLSEAAETYGISRQGIHDMIRRSESALEAYEEKLGLVQKFLDNRRDVGAIRTLAERIRTTQDLSLLNEISALAQRIEDR